MAEASRYSFDLKEVASALIRHQGIHEGLWQLAFEFNFGAALVGATKEEARPSALIQINKFQLVRQAEGAEQQPMVVDAAEVNPPIAATAPVAKGRKPK